MGKVTDTLYDTYITQETNCAETMLTSGVRSRCDVLPQECCRMMSGFSGGVSTENFCGAILGGTAAISLLINHGDEESFERSKEAAKEFVERCEQRFGTVVCHDIKTTWRTEELRCYAAVEIIAQILEEVLQKYADGGTEL